MVMPIISQSKPSYGEGFAMGNLSKRPNLWKNSVAFLNPSLGVTGQTLRDISGHNKHGIFTNMTFDDWVISGNPKSPGYAIDFNGSTEYLDTSILSTLKFTISFWVTKDDDISGNVVGKFNGTEIQQFFYDAINNRYSADFGKVGGTRTQIGTGTNSIELNTWYLVSWTYDGITSSIYLNGLLKESSSVVPDNWLSSQAFNIGRRAGDASYYNGKSGTILMHSQALSAAEEWDLFQYPNAMFEFADQRICRAPAVGGGRIMGSLAGHGGLAGYGGIAGQRGGLAG
jgi:hypothetical protein